MSKLYQAKSIGFVEKNQEKNNLYDFEKNIEFLGFGTKYYDAQFEKRVSLYAKHSIL